MRHESVQTPSRALAGRPGFWVLHHGLLLLGLLLAALPATAAQAGERYALLIGVGDYAQWPPLVNPVPDVRALAAELSDGHGFLVETLENPSRAEILTHLRRYAGMSYGPEDQLVIGFAGHGTYDEVTGLGFLAARDSASRARDPGFDSLIDYPRLLSLIDNIPCGKILVVVDACYSGSLEDFRGAGAGDGKIRRFLTSGGKEYVPDGDPDRHTPFMRQLLAGLRSGDPLTLEALADRFMSRVEPRPRWGRFGGDEGAGDFSFAPRATAVPATVVTAGRAAPETPRAVPAALPAPAAEPRLRARPAAVTESVLERTLRKIGLFDATRNPEGDFPNAYREQSRDLWSVVADLESGLTWQQAGSDHRLSRTEADAYINRLNREAHAGHSDWRLPTLEELASLLEWERLPHGLYVDPLFDAEQETAWSADRDGETGDPYFVSFNAGRATLAYGDQTAFVRAVRND